MLKLHRKNIIVGIFVVLVLLLLLFLSKDKFLNKVSDTSKQTDGRSSLEFSQDEINKMAQNWPVYKNEILGISFKYPKESYGEDVVFIQKGNNLLVTTTSSSVYRHSDELPETYSGNKLSDKIFDLQKKYEVIDKYPNNNIWTISVENASSDNDLKKIIQERLGGRFHYGCKFGGLSTTTQEGLFEVNISPVKEPVEHKNQYDNGDVGSCWINWRFGIFYSPKFKKAAVLDLGQAPIFEPLNKIGQPSSNELDLDSISLKSFNINN